MKITWRSPSNIAFIKYWGKHGRQLPNNASLSMTLHEAYTQTTVELKKKHTKNEIEIDFLFEGKKKPEFSEKIITYFNSVKNDFQIIKKYRLKISSHNSFPHSSGIASSASSMSALALCLTSLSIKTQNIKGSDDFFKMASHYARLGSGSAARSIYGEFCLWGKTSTVKNSNNDFAIPYPEKYHTDFDKLQDTILIVYDKQKNISSSAGHALMHKHTMEKQRYANADKRLKDILLALKKGDWDLFCKTLEADALEIHALMMTSASPYILIHPNTLHIINKMHAFRKETKIPVCFTLDAGPNVHILYPYFEKKKIQEFIEQELLQYCLNKKIIYDYMGNGPLQIIE